MDTSLVHIPQTSMPQTMDLGDVTMSNAERFMFPRIKPMLGKPIQFEDINYDTDHYEVKYDGERMLATVYGSENITLSRCLKPLKFAHRIRIHGHSAIFDGERVYVRNGQVVSICCTGTRENLDEVYMVFDILYYNGKLIVEEPLSARKKLLQQVLIQDEHIKTTDMFPCTSYEHITSKFNELTSNGCEGLMVKSINSKYMPSVREWGKLKLLHLEGRREEVELFLYRVLPDKNGKRCILDCGLYKVDGTDPTKIYLHDIESYSKYKHIVYVSSGIPSKVVSILNLMTDANGQVKEPTIVTLTCDMITTKSLRHPSFQRFRHDLDHIDITNISAKVPWQE